MIGAQVLSRFEDAGYSLTLEGGTIRASGPAAPSEGLRTLAEANRDALKAAVLLSDPPGWLAQLFDLYWSGHKSPVRLTNPASGKVDVYMVSVSIKNIAAAIAAEIGMPVLQWERIRPEVEEALGSWKSGAA